VYRVALTGNIASGKSAVADTWQRAGAAVVDADVLARDAVAPGSQGLAAIAKRFGADVIAKDGTLDRRALRDRVFADEDERHALEAILHPIIAELRDEADRKHAALGTSVVVHVIPLLFETGLEKSFDRVILVDAPEAVRLKRLADRRGLSDDDARRMVAAQMQATTKRERADAVIDNNGTLDDLEAAARAAWRDILERAEETT
jgi:dephospho-CoA kinase